jgi:hypothetical protein
MMLVIALMCSGVGGKLESGLRIAIFFAVVFFGEDFFAVAFLAVAFFGVDFVVFLTGLFLVLIVFSFFSLFWRKSRASPASAKFIISGTTDRYF